MSASSARPPPCRAGTAAWKSKRWGASLFDIFFRFWSEEVARERFPADIAGLMAGALGGLALDLLSQDRHGWFAHGNRHDAIMRAFHKTLDDHTRRLGPDMAQWSWGHSHTIALRHTLSSRGELGQLLNRGGLPVRGSGVTVCNTGYDPNYMAALGANFRLIVDLSTSPPSLQAVDAAGQSGHPGSPNYCDQLPDWIGGQYHSITL
jgi:acyl-homoserine lactone acylase PvdQ